jgi:hypothetical protein
MTPRTFRHRYLLLAGCLALAAYLGREVASHHPPRWLEAVQNAWTGGDSASATADVGNAERTHSAHWLSQLPSEPGQNGNLLANLFPQRLTVASLLDKPDFFDGRGGQGIHQAARRAGVWFPVFSPGQAGAEADPEEAEQASLPLYITSGTPPKTAPDTPLAYRFDAIGGQPPYRWRMTLGLEGFAIDPQSGLLTGQTAEQGQFPLAIYVTDSAGAEDSALYPLRIGSTQSLAIVTTELPPATLGQAYEFALATEGGSPPLAWSIDSPLPAGFTLDAASGKLSGHATTHGYATEISVRVTDADQNEASTTLPFIVSSPFEIVTPSRLPPAAPGAPYQLAFIPAGGQEPIAWRVAEGFLPPAWELNQNGQLNGIAPLTDGVYRFVIEGTDAQGFTTQKAFTLPVRRSLIVVPSREKAGLAWQPREIALSLGAPARFFTVTRSLSADSSAGVPVYQGRGNNFVDRGLATGSTYFYTLHVHPPDSAPIAFATTAITLIPFTKGRGQPGRLADPHADSVRLFRPLSPSGHGASFAPSNVTGPPDGIGTFSPASDPSQVLSLHAQNGRLGLAQDAVGGSIVLGFDDNIIEIAPGEDFTVFENVFFINGDPNQRFMEPATVSVALFEDEWHRFPIDVVPPATATSTPPTMDPFYYNRGFAGRNATTGGDPTDPRQSGGDSFDISQLQVPGLTWVRFVKLQSTGHQALRDDFGGQPVLHTQILGASNGTGSSGFDLDAVTAVHY